MLVKNTIKNNARNKKLIGNHFESYTVGGTSEYKYYWDLKMFPQMLALPTMPLALDLSMNTELIPTFHSLNSTFEARKF